MMSRPNVRLREAGADMNYQAPIWLPGGNLQTIWPALVCAPHAR